MALTQVDDWTVLTGAIAEVRREGATICEGNVDLVTDDGQILWILPSAGTRKLFEKADGFEVHTAVGSLRLRYRLAKVAQDPS